MTKRTVHRILELSAGVPLLLFGGMGIVTDVGTYRWIQEDPEHRWGFVGLGTMIGILPFLMGCWLVIMAVKRSWFGNPVNRPDQTSDGKSESR